MYDIICTLVTKYLLVLVFFEIVLRECLRLRLETRGDTTVTTGIVLQNENKINKTSGNYTFEEKSNYYFFVTLLVSFLRALSLLLGFCSIFTGEVFLL